MPGDHIQIAYGHVYVNDEQLAEPYVPSDYLDARSYSEIVVPGNSYFVLGDHRSMSNDSREFGPVMRSYIYGKAVFGYWPMEKLGDDEHVEARRRPDGPDVGEVGARSAARQGSSRRPR